MALDLYTLFTLIVVSLILLTTKFMFYLRKLPPGPFPLPIIGSLYALTNKSVYEKQYFKWSKKYGDIITVWMGFTPMFVVNGWKLIHEATIVKRDHFIDRYKPTSMLLMNGLAEPRRNGISAEDGKSWEVLRRTAVIILRKYAMSSRMHQNVKWGIEQALKGKELILDSPFDPKNLMFFITQNISAAALIGKRDDNDEDMVKMRIYPALIRDGFTESIWSDSIPIYRLFNRKRLDLYGRGIEDFILLIHRNLKKHRITFQKDDIRDFTDALLASKEQYEDEMRDNSVFFTDDNLAQILMEFFQAGADTTSVTLIWMCKILAHFPDVQNRIWNEIENVTGYRECTPDDRENCPYTQAVLWETLRLCNITTSGFKRRATVDTELGGYHIPKGSVVLLNYCSTSFDCTLFPEPYEFRPERFIDGSTGGFVKAVGMLSFGVGKRSCIGEKLALIHLFLIITSLVRYFRFSLPTDHTPKTLSLNTEPFEIIAFPKPFKIVLTRRNC